MPLNLDGEVRIDLNKETTDAKLLACNDVELGTCTGNGPKVCS